MRLFDRATIDAARMEHSAGMDAVLGLPTRFGLGFSLPPVLSPGAADGAFGHAGAGGSLGFADPENGLAFGYVMNRMALFDHARAHALVDAVYRSI